MAVYFIRAGIDGPIKIGTASDPRARLHELQTAHHDVLQLVREVDGDRSVEVGFHRHFAEYRIRGEWFTFHPSMLTIDPAAIVKPSVDGRRPNDVGAVIAALGGDSALSQALGVVPSAARNWRRMNAFPPRLYLKIECIAVQRGVTLNTSLFRELSGPERESA